MAWQEMGKKILRGNFYPLQNHILNIEQAQTLQLMILLLLLWWWWQNAFKERSKNPIFLLHFKNNSCLIFLKS